MSDIVIPGNPITTGKIKASATKEAVRTRVRQYRARKKQGEILSSSSWDYADLTPIKELPEIMKLRGLTDGHTIEVVCSLARVAGENTRIFTNRYFYLVGPKAAEAALTGTVVPFEPTPQAEVPGELIRLPELRAIYDFSVAWREPDTTFEEFLKIRQMVKSDPFLAGRDIHDKDYHCIHAEWSEFLPQLDPALLKPDYSQEDMKRVLGSMNECKSWLLIASRNSYKSDFVLVWLVSAICMLPDIRALLVSETQPLSAGFCRKLRSYFEILNPNNPTRFQQYFPEFCVPVGDGSELTFECPAAHLRQIASTVEATSLLSKGIAGNRADVVIFDDPVSDKTTGTVEAREKSIQTHDLLLKILEVGCIGEICVATPWHEKDLMATLLDRNEEDPNHPLRWRIDPAWVLKPSAREKSLFQVTKDDIQSLLFPERLTFDYLRAELMKNPRSDKFFRSQNLCEFLPEVDARLKLAFTEAALNAAIRPEPKDGTVFNSWDTASSVERYADLSAGIHFKIYTNDQGQSSIHVCKIVADRFRYSELATEVVQLCKDSSPRTVIIEKVASSDLLGAQFKSECDRQHLANFPIFWKQVSTRVSKFQRIKPLEGLLAAGRLTFSPLHNWDDVVRQFTELDGHSRSGGNRKDDIPDAIALGSEFLPDVQPDFVATQRAQDQLQRQRDIQGHKDWIFGQGAYSPKTPPPQKAGKPRNAAGAWGLYLSGRTDLTAKGEPANASAKKNRFGFFVR